MNREKWEFEYTAIKLAEASKAKAEVHRTKFAWWEGKKKEVAFHQNVAVAWSRWMFFERRNAKTLCDHRTAYIQKRCATL